MKSGFVSIIGRPNAGKSTLLNSIMNEKIAITSNKPQTTRNNIKGIYTDDSIQIVFLDTPGVHKPKHKLGDFLNQEAYYSLYDADVVYFMVDVNEPFGKGDEFVLEKIKGIDKPIFLILNKVDRVNKQDLLPLIFKYKDIYDFAEIIPLSAYKNDGVELLLKTTEKYLKDEFKYYEDDLKTDQEEHFRVKELIREKVLRLTEKEVPHSAECIVDRIEIGKTSDHIYATIVVDRDSLKRIIIGKNGSKIKEIGMLAREDIEKLINKKVYLELFVKVIKNWRDKDNLLNDLGYKK